MGPRLGSDGGGREVDEARQRLVASRGSVALPFEALVRAPQLCNLVGDLGEHLRFHGSLDDRLRETAILATAQVVRCDFEYRSHLPLARAAGVAEATVAATGGRGAPVGNGDVAPADEAAVVAFCQELLAERVVAAPTFAAVDELLSTAQIVELCTLVGYYALLAGVINAFELDVRAGG